MRKQKVLIVGGAGFIGWQLTEQFLRNNQEVYLYDDLSVGWKESFERKNVTGILGNILDTNLLINTLQTHGITQIYHLAAIHHIPTCENDPTAALKINVDGTQSLLSACAATQSIEKIIFASSGAVYDLINGPISEDSPINPRDIYGISKVCGEQLIRYHSNKYNIQTVIARFFNTVGKKETNDHLLPAVIRKLKENPHKIELGNLDPKRDYIHVNDMASALYAISNFSSPNLCEVFNIGSGVEYSVQDVILKISLLLKHPIEVISSPGLRRKVDRLNQLANIDKARTLLGWQPKHSLDIAIKDILEEASLLQCI
jgi:UDP-glucose 4-epimerase